MEIPLLDIKSQLKPIHDQVLKAIIETIESTRYILGPKVEELEEKLAGYCAARYCIGVSSGTDALLISLMGLGIGPGDLVITTPYSFFATAGVIARLHARPVFVDTDPITYNISPKKLAETLQNGTSGRITLQPFDVSKIKAIIPVHLYGQCADMKEILSIASLYSIPVIEDAAQAIGAEYQFNGSVKKAGSMGLTGCFSFFPSKNLGCMGDGGMVITNDDQFAEKLRILRVHGGTQRYYHKVVGGNFRLDAIQAAILNVKLPYLDKWHLARQKNAQTYNELFSRSGIVSADKITPPSRVYYGRSKDIRFDHIFNQYVIRANERDNLKIFLQENGVSSEIYYPVPFHLQECFSSLSYRIGDFPESERAASETLALPVYPELTIKQQDYIVGVISRFYDKFGK